MLWITCTYVVDNHVTHITYRCCPQHMVVISTSYTHNICFHSIVVIPTVYAHSICCPQHMVVIPTLYTHSICNPRYMFVISTTYIPHYMSPQYIPRHPQHMCCPHHMHMVWVTLTLFSTAYAPQHKLLSTAYTHSICRPYILWVYAVDTTCICCGSHMLWVHMSSADVNQWGMTQDYRTDLKMI